MPEPHRTTYDEILNAFLLSIKDYNLLDIPQKEAEAQARSLLRRAIGQLQDLVWNTSGIDLFEYDDEQERFEMEVPPVVVNLLVLTMVEYWFSPFLLNTEHMHNIMNTRDFSQFAPHNMLDRMTTLHEQLQDTIRRERSWYAQRYGYLKTVGSEG